jgi:hypothetical protein
MSTATHVVECFGFTDPNGRQAFCRIELVPMVDGLTAVIATERSGNPGMSITNAAEQAATAVCRRYGIDPHRLVWIEHYDADSYADQERKETFDLVTFRRIHAAGATILDGPTWRRIGESDWATLGLPNIGTIPA